MNTLRKLIPCLLLVIALSSCGGPEAKRDKFMQKGIENFEAGNYVSARLDFKNTLQIDPKFGQGYLMLAKAELQLKNYKAAYGFLNKSLQYQPEDPATHLELGQLFLAARQGEKAEEKADFVLEKEPGNLEAIILKASALTLMKKHNLAIALLEPIVTPDLQLEQGFNVLATCYQLNGDHDKGKEILTAGIQAVPDSAILQLQLARHYARNDDVDQAASHLNAAISLQPDNIALPYQLADLYWKFNKQDDAAATILQQVKNDPENELPYLRGVAFYSKHEALDRAETLLKDGIATLADNFKLRFTLSEVYLKQKDGYKALDVLQTCTTLIDDQADPKILEAKLRLAKLHMLMRELPKTQDLIDEILAQSPKSIEARLLNGQIFLSRGQAEQAVAEFRTVVDDKPEYITSYILLAKAHIADRKLELAKNVLGEALQIDPEAREALRFLTRLQAQDKDYGSAEKSLRKILAKKPDDTQVRTELGDVFLLSKQFGKAEKEYELAVKNQPENPAGYLKLSRLYGHQKQWTAAINTLENGFQRNPESLGLFVTLIKFYMNSDYTAEAVALCNDVVSRHPDKAVGYAMLGKVYAHLKRYDEAESQLQHAIERQPAWQAPYRALAEVYLQQGKEDQAIERVEKLIKLNPDNMSAYLGLASIHERTKNFQDAIKIYRQMLDKNPDSWIAANNLAFLLTEEASDNASLNEALALAEHANKLRPEEGVVLDTLGWIYFRKGDLGQAIINIEQALKKAPDVATFNYHAAVVYNESGRQTEARDQLEKALSQTDDFQERPEAEKLQKKLL